MGGQFHEKFGNFNYPMGKRLDVNAVAIHSAVCPFSFVQTIELSTPKFFMHSNWAAPILLYLINSAFVNILYILHLFLKVYTETCHPSQTSCTAYTQKKDCDS